MTATVMPAEKADKPVDPRPALAKHLADAEKRLAAAIAARDARATELAEARSDATAKQTSFEDGKGTPAAAAQARALVDVLAAALTKNEAAVSNATGACVVAADDLAHAQDLIDAERLPGEIATGLAAIKEKRREVVSAFREGVGEFRTLQSQAGAAQQQLAKVLDRLFVSEDGKANAKAACEYVEQLGQQGVDVSGVHLRIDPDTSCWLTSGLYKDSTLRLGSMEGWEREFDRQSGRG